MLFVVNDIVQPILVAKALVKTFPAQEGSVPVLNGIDLRFSRGESISIRGESGSGKSTLLNVLSGLEVADSGSLEWQGQGVSSQSLSSLARLRQQFIGFVFQSYYLAPELNSLENVLLGARIAGSLNENVRARAIELLERVGMGHRLQHNATKLSGGERQRVAVARALINDPPLILADEPTGNLDEATGAAVMDLLLEMVEEDKKSLILVTHNPEFAARTQQQLILRRGVLGVA